MLDIALGKHVDRAGLRFDDGTIAHSCLGIALADQHADDTRRACLGARAGGGGQNVDQVFFAFRLDRHVLCRRDERIRSRFGKSGVSGDDGRNGAACRRSIARHIHGGGHEDQIGKVLGENADAAICGGKACAIAHGRAYFIPSDDHVHRAADGSGLRTDTRAAEDTGHGDRENIVLCFGADEDVIAGSDHTVAHTCADLASVVHTRDIHAHACSAGAGERAADHTAVHAAYRFHRCFAAVKDNDCAIGDSGGGITSGKEHGERACRRCLRIRSHGNSARNGLHIIVHGCQIVQHIHGTHDHLGAEIHLNAVVLLVAVGILLAVADIEMDEALVVGAGLIHASVRNGKEILEVEGELVVISGNRLLFRRDFQAAGGDGCALADFGKIDVLVIDQREGSADAHAGAAGGDAAGSDRDFGLFHGAHHHVAAVHHGAVQDLGAALSIGLDHGHGARKTHGISLASHCACQGLGCQKARELAVQILSENGIGRDAAFGAEIAGKRSVCLIVVDTDSDTHGEHIGIDQGVEGLRNACAGGIGAVVRAVFRPGVNALCGKAAADQSLGLMGSNIDTHSRGNIHRGAGEPGRILSGSTGFLQRLVCGAVGHSGTGGKVQAQHAHHHGHQGAAANAVCNRSIARRGDLVELPHNHAVYDAGRGVIGEVRDAESSSDFLEIAVKACAVGKGEGLGLIFVQSFRINNDTPSYVSLPVKLRVHIGSGEIDGNGSSNRGGFAGGKAGGSGVGLTTLTGAQVKIRLLIDIFALFVCGNSCGADDIPAAERQASALIDRGSDRVLHKIERHGGIHRDVLGAGLVCGQSLSDGRSLIVRERLLSADGILTGNGNRVNVVVNNGLGAERAGGNDSVLTNARLCRCVHIGHSKGRAHAYTLTADLTADLVFDGQAVVRRGGGCGGVDFVGGLGIQLQNTGQLHLVLGIGSFQSGEDGSCVRVEDRQGKASSHAHVGGACAGDGGGADSISNIFQLAGIAVFGGKLGNGGFQKQIQADRGHHLLFFQFLTDSGNGGLILQQSLYKEAGVKEQVGQILQQAVCQSHCPGGDGAQRIALQIGEHDLEDHILHDAVLLVLKLLQLRVGKLFLFAESVDILLKELVPLLFGEVVQQGVFALLLIEKSLNKNVSAGVGIREVAQKLRDDLVHAAAVFRFQDVRADNEIVSLDGLRAHIGSVLILHVVDGRCRAHTDGAVAGGGVGEDDSVGILKGGDTDIACGLNGQAVRDNGARFVGMNICRDGCRHLHAALGGLHTGALACQGGHTIRGHAALFAGQGVNMARRIAQSRGVILVDILRDAVLVHGRAWRCVSGVAGAAKQICEVLDLDIGRSGGADHRRRVCALGAGIDILAYAADGLRRHAHALRFYAAVKFRHSGVVQDGKTHCRAYACPAAHCLRVRDELTNGLGARGDNHVTGQFGHGAVELAHDRLGVHRA